MALQRREREAKYSSCVVLEGRVRCLRPTDDHQTYIISATAVFTWLDDQEGHYDDMETAATAEGTPTRIHNPQSMPRSGYVYTMDVTVYQCYTNALLVLTETESCVCCPK